MSRPDIKIVLLGGLDCGKTCLVERYIRDRFGTPQKLTLGAAFETKKIDVAGRTLILGIWDTAGQERFQSMTKLFYRHAQAAIVCYDVTDRSSFQRAKFWVNEMQANEKLCRLYLCGTKKDLVDGENKYLRQVCHHVVADYADEIRAEVFETSSKTSENIQELFLKIAEDYVKEPVNSRSLSYTEGINLLEPPEPAYKCSCCH